MHVLLAVLAYGALPPTVDALDRDVIGRFVERFKRTPPSHHAGGAKGVAICEICSILYGNVASALCGIIALSSMGKMQP